MLKSEPSTFIFSSYVLEPSCDMTIRSSPLLHGMQNCPLLSEVWRWVEPPIIMFAPSIGLPASSVIVPVMFCDRHTVAAIIVEISNIMRFIAFADAVLNSSFKNVSNHLRLKTGKTQFYFLCVAKIMIFQNTGKFNFFLCRLVERFYVKICECGLFCLSLCAK